MIPVLNQFKNDTKKSLELYQKNIDFTILLKI